MELVNVHIFIIKYSLEFTKRPVTNYREEEVGGHQNRRGGGKFYPFKKRGGGGMEKVLAMLKGGNIVLG